MTTMNQMNDTTTMVGAVERETLIEDLLDNGLSEEQAHAAVDIYDSGFYPDDNWELSPGFAAMQACRAIHERLSSLTEAEQRAVEANEQAAAVAFPKA